MKIEYICPIVDRKINEKVARLNAFFTMLLVITFLISKGYLVVVILAVDFYLRGSNMSKFSPLAHLSKLIVNIFNLEEIKINAGPKIFAARVGLFFSVSTLILLIAGVTNMAIFLIVILGTFSFLESFFGVCVACYIYPYILKLGNIN